MKAKMATASGGLHPPDPLLPQILYSGQPSLISTTSSTPAVILYIPTRNIISMYRRMMERWGTDLKGGKLRNMAMVDRSNYVEQCAKHMHPACRACSI